LAWSFHQPVVGPLDGVLQLLHRTKLFTSLRIDPSRLAIVPRLRTSPSGSANATAIVSAWTSNPKYRTFCLMTVLFRSWL
jgi:hypothetical protein